jgi:hypothetical protein
MNINSNNKLLTSSFLAYVSSFIEIAIAIIPVFAFHVDALVFERKVVWIERCVFQI